MSDPEYAGMLTYYVGTRHYRAPEVLLNPGGYTVAIDIWGVGCTLAEMLNGTTLFRSKDRILREARLLLVMTMRQAVQGTVSFKFLCYTIN